MHMLKTNFNKIDWGIISVNPAIFEADKEGIIKLAYQLNKYQ